MQFLALKRIQPKITDIPDLVTDLNRKRSCLEIEWQVEAGIEL